MGGFGTWYILNIYPIFVNTLGRVASILPISVGEMGLYALDKDYTFEAEAPTILEIDGVRYGFLICYDAYFYESFANIARFDPDVIVACSHQRRCIYPYHTACTGNYGTECRA